MATFDHTSQLQKLKELYEQSQRHSEMLDRNFDTLFKLFSILNPNINNTTIGDLEVTESIEEKSVHICFDEEDESLESELIPHFFFIENEDAIKSSSYSHSSVSKSSTHEETLASQIPSNHIDSNQRGVDEFSNSKPRCESLKFDTVKYEKAYSTNLKVSHLIHDSKVLFNSKLLGKGCIYPNFDSFHTLFDRGKHHLKSDYKLGILPYYIGSNILDKTTDEFVLKLFCRHGYRFSLLFMNSSVLVFVKTGVGHASSNLFVRMPQRDSVWSLLHDGICFYFHWDFTRSFFDPGKRKAISSSSYRGQWFLQWNSRLRCLSHVLFVSPTGLMSVTDGDNGCEGNLLVKLSRTTISSMILWTLVVVPKQIYRRIVNMCKSRYTDRVDAYLFIIIVFASWIYDRGKVFDRKGYFYFSDTFKSCVDTTTSRVTIIFVSNGMAEYSDESVYEMISELEFYLDLVFASSNVFLWVITAGSGSAYEMADEVLESNMNSIMLLIWKVPATTYRFLCYFCCDVLNLKTKSVKPLPFNIVTVYSPGFCPMYFHPSVHQLSQLWPDGDVCSYRLSTRLLQVLNSDGDLVEFCVLFHVESLCTFRYRFNSARSLPYY